MVDNVFLDIIAGRINCEMIGTGAWVPITQPLFIYTLFAIWPGKCVTIYCRL